MKSTMEQRNTKSGKSNDNSNEEKLYADNTTNIIPINILNRPSPIQEYRYDEFERSGRLSRNRARGSKSIFIFFFFFSLSSRSLLQLKFIYNPLFSHVANKKWRNATQSISKEKKQVSYES